MKTTRVFMYKLHVTFACKYILVPGSNNATITFFMTTVSQKGTTLSSSLQHHVSTSTRRPFSSQLTSSFYHETQEPNKIVFVWI